MTVTIIQMREAIMQIIPQSFNHIKLILDNGEILDINDGTKTKNGNFIVKLDEPTHAILVPLLSVSYDAAIRIKFD